VVWRRDRGRRAVLEGWAYSAFPEPHVRRPFIYNSYLLTYHQSMQNIRRVHIWIGLWTSTMVACPYIGSVLEWKCYEVEWEGLWTAEVSYASSQCSSYWYITFRTLVKLLNESKDPLVLAVAAHDVGQYVKHCDRGKKCAIFQLRCVCLMFTLESLMTSVRSDGLWSWWVTTI
jgi:hypothetical protein